MSRSARLLAALVFLVSPAAARSEDTAPASRKKLADGVYAVRRDSFKKKNVLPLKDGEVLLVDRHRYLKNDKDEPPRFLVVRSAAEVALELAGEPKAVKQKGVVVRILLKLQPKAATALERLTRDHLGRQ